MIGSEREHRGNIIVIEDFMKNELCLRGAALLIYAVIYSFCKSAGSFYASVDYLAERVGASRRSVYNALASLIRASHVIRLGKHQVYGTVEYGININRKMQNAKSESETERQDNTDLTAKNEAPEGKTDLSHTATDSANCVKEKGHSQRSHNIRTGADSECSKSKASDNIRDENVGESDNIREENVGESDSIREEKARASENMSKENFRASENKKYTRMQAEISQSVQKTPYRDTYFDDIPCLSAFESQRFGNIPKDYDRFAYYYCNGFSEFGDGHVLLTEDQYDYLIDWVGEYVTEIYIDRLESCILNNKKFHSFSHFKTLKKWIMKDMSV